LCLRDCVVLGRESRRFSRESGSESCVQLRQWTRCIRSKYCSLTSVSNIRSVCTTIGKEDSFWKHLLPVTGINIPIYLFFESIFDLIVFKFPTMAFTTVVCDGLKYMEACIVLF
jgi:hypothetical protein